MSQFEIFIHCSMYQNNYKLVKGFQIFTNIDTNTNKFIYFQRHLKYSGHPIIEAVIGYGSKRPPSEVARRSSLATPYQLRAHC